MTRREHPSKGFGHLRPSAALDGFSEALGLERAAAVEHETTGDRLWRARQYVEALREYRAAEVAWDRVAELERVNERSEQ